MKCPEEANLWRQRGDGWLPRAERVWWGWGGRESKWMGFLLEGNENIPKQSVLMVPELCNYTKSQCILDNK